MTKQERKVVVDSPFAISEVGVAHPAGLHPHDYVAAGWVGHDDVGELGGRVLGAGDDTSTVLGIQIPSEKLR
jgi:hypothetical protein